MVNASVLVREFLLTQASVTSLLGTNRNGSIYCSYDVPQGFNPDLGPAIQIFRNGGIADHEILQRVNARLQIRVWTGKEQVKQASTLYGAIFDVLHGATGVTLTTGTLMSALEETGPQEMTDPELGWVAINSFYAVMARPN